MRIRLSGQTDKENFKENVADRFFEMVEDDEKENVRFTLIVSNKNHDKTDLRLSNAIDAVETLVQEDGDQLGDVDYHLRKALEKMENYQIGMAEADE